MFSGDWWRVGLVSVLIASGGFVSAAYGIPAEAPAASLGWPLLLHLERSVAFLGLLVMALLVGVRATRGTFPVKFGQVEYPAERVDRREETVVDTYDKRLRVIERALTGLSGRGEHDED